MDQRVSTLGGCAFVVATRTAKKNWATEIKDRQNTGKDISELAEFLKKQSTQLDREAKKSTKKG